MTLTSGPNPDPDPDLLQAKKEELQSTALQALRANAQNTIELHRDQNASVLFYDDAACARLVQEVEPRLLRHWRNETRDMYRHALCRGVALLKTGGLVFDAELESRIDVRWPAPNPSPTLTPTPTPIPTPTPTATPTPTPTPYP